VLLLEFAPLPPQAATKPSAKYKLAQALRFESHHTRSNRDLVPLIGSMMYQSRFCTSNPPTPNYQLTHTLGELHEESLRTDSGVSRKRHEAHLACIFELDSSRAKPDQHAWSLHHLLMHLSSCALKRRRSKQNK
jgi:hypothetical protein